MSFFNGKEGKMYTGLKKAMKQNDDNYNDLCELLKLPKGSISRRMNKKLEFKITEINKILKRYNKSYEELFLK